jgi:uncharacterized membrane protein
MVWQAPFPPASMCREYEYLDPGFTARLMEETRMESAHRCQLDISESRRQTAGLWITAWLATLVFLIGGGLIYSGHEWGAGVMISAFVTLAGASVYRVRSLSKASAPPALPPPPDDDPASAAISGP